MKRCMVMLALLIAITGSAAGELTLLIAPVSGDHLTTGEKKAVAIRFEGLLFEKKYSFSLLGHENVRSSTEQGCQTYSCAIALGKSVSASKVLQLYVENVNESYRIKGELIDVNEGYVGFTFSENCNGCSFDELMLNTLPVLVEKCHFVLENYNTVPTIEEKTVVSTPPEPEVKKRKVRRLYPRVDRKAQRAYESRAASKYRRKVRILGIITVGSTVLSVSSAIRHGDSDRGIIATSLWGVNAFVFGGLTLGKFIQLSRFRNAGIMVTPTYSFDSNAVGVNLIKKF